MNKIIKNDNEVRVSCYVDKNTQELLIRKSSELGLSVSAYIRFLIKKDISKM